MLVDAPFSLQLLWMYRCVKRNPENDGEDCATRLRRGDQARIIVILRRGSRKGHWRRIGTTSQKLASEAGSISSSVDNFGGTDRAVKT
jgi:hypothetical protein